MLLVIPCLSQKLLESATSQTPKCSATLAAAPFMAVQGSKAFEGAVAGHAVQRVQLSLVSIQASLLPESVLRGGCRCPVWLLVPLSLLSPLPLLLLTPAAALS